MKYIRLLSASFLTMWASGCAVLYGGGDTRPPEQAPVEEYVQQVQTKYSSKAAALKRLNLLLNTKVSWSGSLIGNDCIPGTFKYANDEGLYFWRCVVVRQLCCGRTKVSSHPYTVTYTKDITLAAKKRYFSDDIYQYQVHIGPLAFLEVTSNDAADAASEIYALLEFMAS